MSIMIDDDHDKKLRTLQGQMIQEKQESYSYSRVVNDVIRKGLK